MNHLRKEYSLNAQWKFIREDAEGMEQPSFFDRHWEKVSLPHTPKIETLYEQFPWQGVCCYRHDFLPEEDWRGQNIALVFGGAMQIAEVWLNGELLLRHMGGYQKFSIDISDKIQYGQNNVIAVRLDNRDTPLCPPGKPTETLDFSYHGGLYRGVSLLVQNPLHISDAIAADIEAGGGIFVTYGDVAEDSATANAKVHVQNRSKEVCRRVAVHKKLYDRDNVLVAERQSTPVIISAGEGHHFCSTLQIAKPNLWSPDTPYLYTLETLVYHDGVLSDRVTIKIGIRQLRLDGQLYVNGILTKIMGTNRHQEFPYVGYAVSTNAARRDAVKIKEGGFNLVRLSHYPQDEAFLDACDELGIMVQNCIPGWQMIHMNAEFINNSLRDTREMIRRDRNHPCVVFWEPNLNETYGDHQDFCRAQYEIAHREYPGDQCFTFGDAYPTWEWGGWDVKNYQREYGDWNFGGNESTSRHLRGEGEEAMLQQAWNFIWTYNYLNRQYADPARNYSGSGTWVMFDYNRGYYHEPCSSGMMDIFRLPKYIWHFYRSQKNPDIYGENIFIANEWTERSSPCKVVVFSNCEEVELVLNGKPIKRQQPDSGADSDYSEGTVINLATIGDQMDASGGNPFDGGNCKQIEHPPVTFFDIPYETGKLEAIGYRNHQPVTSCWVSTPLAPVSIQLELDTCEIAPHADESDFIFLRARCLDENHRVVPINGGKVTFEVIEGKAEIIGDNPVSFEWGIASVLLKTYGGGKCIISAKAEDIGGDRSFKAVINM